jgi:hypothetical protein
VCGDVKEDWRGRRGGLGWEDGRGRERFFFFLLLLLEGARWGGGMAASAIGWFFFLAEVKVIEKGLFLVCSKKLPKK